MLYGDLRGFAEALITRDKYKVDGSLRDLADAIISGDKYKVPDGQLRELADALIRRDKYRVSDGPLREFADALINNDKYKAPDGLRDLADAILTGDKYKVSSGSGCYIATATLGHAAYEDLDILRHFRDTVVMSTDFGTRLVTYYRRIAPSIAMYIEDKSILKKSFLYPFILPAIKILKILPHGLFSKGIAYGIFLVCLAWATIVSSCIMKIVPRYSCKKNG
ncbi:hypothetical protein U27_06582 [Candidatus Vecturithrix granuli]|uniref:Uncharacterized protein n=1 Tax=Vecturithrix granuli TaxID=1499967 RepID=A0A081C4U2_VECG1|nr:hypothetical protein U27_06582 [Candidatus Vecturithrix granuli]